VRLPTPAGLSTRPRRRSRTSTARWSAGPGRTTGRPGGRAEFGQRLREDPGHRWDHWWLALIDEDGDQVPGGALVSSVSPPDSTGAAGSYVDYIGVHRRARGRGVAKALLNTVLADAAARGRNRVALEVDADSPTGADGLYRSMGWETAYVTESWQRDLTV
jgi:GNAT superfamily N-acetyltransferase